MKLNVSSNKFIQNIIQLNKKFIKFINLNELDFKNFNIIYILSLSSIILFYLNYGLFALGIILILFNFDFFISNHQLDNDFIINDEDNNDALQVLINQLWKNKLITLFQDQLNQFYSIKRKEKKTFLFHGIQFYNFNLNENQPPTFKKIFKLKQTKRKDEITFHLEIIIFGNVFLRIVDEQKNKNFSNLGDLDLLNQFNKKNNLKFKKKSNTLNDDNIYKQHFINLLVKKFNFELIDKNQLEDVNKRKKNFLVKNLSLSSKSKITFRPLIKFFPYFTCLSFSFLNKPVLYDEETKIGFFDQLNQFENILNKKLILMICSSFIYPNEIYIFFWENIFIDTVHNYLIKNSLQNFDGSLYSSIKSLLNDKKILKEDKFFNNKKLFDWYQDNIEKNFMFIKMNYKIQAFHLFPIAILKLNIIELLNIRYDIELFKFKENSINHFLFIKTNVGQSFKINFSILVNCSPIINQVILLPIHDYYDKCVIQFFIVNTNIKNIENYSNLFENDYLEQNQVFFLGKLVISLNKENFELKIFKSQNLNDLSSYFNKNSKNLLKVNSKNLSNKKDKSLLDISCENLLKKSLENKHDKDLKDSLNAKNLKVFFDKNSQYNTNKDVNISLNKITENLLIKDSKNLLKKNISSNKEINTNAKDEEKKLNLNGQDFWLPLNLNQTLIHLSCTIIKLRNTINFLDKSLNNIKKLNLTKQNLKKLGLPLVFMKVYVDNFDFNYNKENKIKIKKNQLDLLEIKIFNQTKIIETNKKLNNRNYYEKSVYFFIFENPFNDYIIIELKIKKKYETSTKDVINKEVDEKNFKFISFLKLKDLKCDFQIKKEFLIREKKMIYFKILPVYIMNMKEYENFFSFKKIDKETKFIDFEEYGKLTLSITFGFTELNENLINKNFITTKLKGFHNELNKKKIKSFNLKTSGSFDNFEKSILPKLNEKSLSENSLPSIIKNEKNFKNLTEDCIGTLKFKLINTDSLEIKILKVINIPYDKTKKVNLRVMIELWKGNNKISIKKSPYTNIVVNPVFDHKFEFDINLGNLIQYSIRFILIQSTGFFNSTQKVIANKFCTLPLLTLELNKFTRSYILKTNERLN